MANMKRIFLMTLLSSVILATTSSVFAQDYIPIFTKRYSSRLSLEIDPVTFLLKGYSLHARYQPMFSERLLIGVGTYALDLPDAIVDFNKENRDMGWEARIRSAYFLYGEFYPGNANHGWFIGEQIGFQSYKVSNETEVSGTTSFNTILLMTYAGYSWHPYKGSFYIKPWIGLGFTEKIDGINQVGGLKYEVGPFFPFFTFHVGYTF